MAKGGLGISYEERDGVWHILWYCEKYGDVLKDQPLKGRSGAENTDI